MKITNRSNLPASLVAAVTFSDRNTEGCAYTISELLLPPRILALKRKHDAEIEEDAADMLWRLLGQAGHEVLRRAGKGQGNAIIEERAVIDLNMNGRTFKIGGQVDYACLDHTLTDFKFTSSYAIKDGCKSDWLAQLNLYRWLLNHYGVQIDKLQIVAILRDWSVREARRDRDYPQTQAKVFDVPPWPWDQCEAFVKDRIALHEQAKERLPECTDEERWTRPQKFAIKSPSKKRAIKLCATKEEAETLLIGNQFIEYRPAEYPRCESYCPCSKFCEQNLRSQKVLPLQNTEAEN